MQIEDSESYLEPTQSIEEGVIAMSLQEHIDSLNQNQKNAVLRKYIRIKLVEAIKKRYLIEQQPKQTSTMTSHSQYSKTQSTDSLWAPCFIVAKPTLEARNGGMKGGT